MEVIIGDCKVITKRWMKNGMDRVYINGYPDDVKIWIEADDMYGIRVSAKKGEILYLAASHFTGLKESEVRLADSQKNSYDLMFDKMAQANSKLTDDFRTVAKVLADKNPELGSWLFCNWGSELSGHI